MTEAGWLAGKNPGRMLWSLPRDASERKMRLFSLACCRRVADLLRDEWSSVALEVAEMYLEGQKTVKCLEAGYTAINRVFRRRGHPVGSPERFAAHAASCATCPRAPPHRYDAYFAAHTADHAAAARGRPLPGGRRSASGRERQAQAQLLRCVFGSPFRPASIQPAWLTPTVAHLAAVAYEERAMPSGELDAQCLQVFADDLEEAGCSDADLLKHCRGPGPHVRGC